MFHRFPLWQSWSLLPENPNISGFPDGKSGGVLTFKENCVYNLPLDLLTIYIDTEKREDSPSFTQVCEKNRKHMKTFSSDMNKDGSFGDNDVVFTKT
jgi:hypothetical protein